MMKTFNEIIKECWETEMTDRERLFKVRLAIAVLTRNVLCEYEGYKTRIEIMGDDDIEMTVTHDCVDDGRIRYDRLEVDTTGHFSNVIKLNGKETLRADSEEILYPGDILPESDIARSNYSDNLIDARLDLSDGSVLIDSLLYLLTLTFATDYLDIIKHDIQTTCIDITKADYDSGLLNIKDIQLAVQLAMKIYDDDDVVKLIV